jgi:hypothetical protein
VAATAPTTAPTTAPAASKGAPTSAASTTSTTVGHKRSHSAVTVGPPTTRTTSPPFRPVTAAATCTPPGAVGLTIKGTPMTCAPQSCAGTPYNRPRWRRMVC